MWKRLLLSILILAWLSPLTFSLAETPPSDLDDTLKTIVNNGYDVTFTSRGWGSVYDLPQSQFSIDDEDFFDNANEFGKIGLYALGLETLLNPQFAGLDLNAGMSAKITHAAEKTLPWVWTAGDVEFGTKHKQKLPNNGITNVLEKITGISGTSNACVNDASIAYNVWGVPKDTINKQTNSQLSTLAGAGYIYLAAAQLDNENKEEYMMVAKGIGDMLLDAIVTPEGESFGIHASQTIDTYGHTIPEGMMPFQFTILTDSPDTELCTDGGTIKIQENRKTHIAQAILFWKKLAEETGDSTYARAADIAEKGILSIQECDGSYKDYTRWEGAGINTNTCTPDDGSESYEAYPAHVAVAETKGFITDMSVLFHLLQEANPTIYNENANFKKAMHYLLQLEEEDTIGTGKSINGDPIRYASYAIDVENRSFTQLLLGHAFLRASCVENDSAMEARLQQRAYHLLDVASNLIPSELDSKIANSAATDPNNNILAVSAAADAWKIITAGCEDCVDSDGDNYINGTCAGDTVKYDCNDNDAAIHPGATETCDNVDNDCDGTVDNGFDVDDDGVTTCAVEIDCNDNSNEVYPGADEKVDGADNDCNGKIDDAGIEASVNTDANTGVSGIEIVFIEYGNVCANSFASVATSIGKIKAQCATIGTCTTDANGTCTLTLKEDGQYQALADIPNKGMKSDVIDFEAGQHVDVVFQTTGSIDMNASADVNAAKPNPFTSNPYFLAGFVLVGVIVGGIILFYLVKTGKLKPVALRLGGKNSSNTKNDAKTSNDAKNSSMSSAGVKVEASRNGKQAGKPFVFSLPKLKLPSLPRAAPKEEKNESSMLYSPKMSPGQKIASKIVGGAPIGSTWEEKLKQKKPLNFPKKEDAGKKKVWKDD